MTQNVWDWQREACILKGGDVRARYLQVGLALGLMASAPMTLGQKLNKCSDGKGGTIFTQEKCAETADQADVRNKERERIEAEARAKKEEEARKKAASIEKAKERDKAYQEQAEEKAREQKKIQEAEQKLMEGTSKEKGVDDGTLPAGVTENYPGAWKEIAHAEIAAALGKNKVPACPQYRYRQRGGGLPEFVVQCTTDKANWVTYFVWPKAEVVKGPAKF